MTFYDQLAPTRDLDDALDPARYRPAPGDWHLAMTDIAGSTRAIEQGHQKSVNMIAAACIAAVRNTCAGLDLPYLFGGDGATMLIPPEHAAAAFAALSGVRAFVLASTGLVLRAGAMRVDALRAHGHDVLVARYETSPGNSLAMFRGGGVSFLDHVLKGRQPGVLPDIAALPGTLSEPDLTGLSCLWQPIVSRNGRMVSIVVAMADPDGDYRPVLRRLFDIAGEHARPAAPEMLEATLRRSWLPTREAVDMELAAAGVKTPLGRFLKRQAILAKALLLRLSLRLGIGRAVAERYVRETARNSDFCKIDDMLQIVIDCTPEALVRIEACLAEQEAAGILGFGLYASDTAVMTCLVRSMAEGAHVHFIDVTGGGYTRAAKILKAKVAQVKLQRLPG